ncbi:hypothetical protein KUG88_18200 [Rhodococcus rhodochrous]|uniref:hypothetical protein n=1 Tax=Rhodococcus rhodochrous TaxID=1829 RepID=UPI001E4AE75F|nr:hypothetical protein [Rhodococcus rhodochrous]MCB8912063.1 hypothetical protein [Rhodococcus rhodochrous]
MAPVMPHQDSRARAAEAFRLRGKRRTWKQIADALGYKTTTGARQAVERYLAANPPAKADDMRRIYDESLRLVAEKMWDLYEDAVTRGDVQDAAVAARELRALQTESVKLWGLYAPTQHTVAAQVTVDQTPTAILARAEADLLAAFEARQQTAIEGEVVQ